VTEPIAVPDENTTTDTGEITKEQAEALDFTQGAAAEARFHVRLESSIPVGLIEELSHRIACDMTERIVTGVFSDALDEFKASIAFDIAGRVEAMIRARLDDPGYPPDTVVTITTPPEPTPSQWHNKRTPEERVLLVHHPATDHRQAIYRLRVGPGSVDLLAGAKFVTLRYVGEKQLIEVMPWPSRDAHEEHGIIHGHHLATPYAIQTKGKGDEISTVVEGYNWSTRLPEGLPEEYKPGHAKWTGMIFLDCASPLFPRSVKQGDLDLTKRAPIVEEDGDASEE
jgi:hypothetical protein